jgi:hypothetical protein
VSLTKTVVEMVEDREGETTVDDILHQLHPYTRAQVIQALQNARYEKRIRIVRVGVARGRHGNAPGVYAPLEDHEPPRPEPTERPVASVFEMGDRARAEQFGARSRALGRMGA